MTLSGEYDGLSLAAFTTTSMLNATPPPYIWTLAFYICALKRPSPLPPAATGALGREEKQQLWGPPKMTKRTQYRLPPTAVSNWATYKCRPPCHFQMRPKIGLDLAIIRDFANSFSAFLFDWLSMARPPILISAFNLA